MQTTTEPLPERITRETWAQHHFTIRGRLRARIVRAVGNRNQSAIDEALSEALCLCFERCCVDGASIGVAISRSAIDALRQLGSAREVFVGDAIEDVANGQRWEDVPSSRPRRGATRFVRGEDFARWETISTVTAILASHES